MFIYINCIDTRYFYLGLQGGIYLYYLKNFSALIIILGALSILFFNPLNLIRFKVYIWGITISIFLLQRYRLTQQVLIISSASFILLLFIACNIYSLGKYIIIKFSLLLGLILFTLICAIDHLILRHFHR